MERLIRKQQNIIRRTHRVRAVVSGTTERPRLTVNISHRHINAQLVDDSRQATIASSSTVGLKPVTGTMTERAAQVGNEIAKKALAAKVKKVVFDRNRRLYHGRIKALAEAARAGGLEF